MNCRPNRSREQEREPELESCWMNDWRTKVCQNNILLNLIIAMKIGRWQQLIVCVCVFFATWIPSKTYTHTHAQINPRTRINVKLTLPNGILLSFAPILSYIVRLNGNIFCCERHLFNMYMMPLCTASGYNEKCYNIYSIWELGPEMIEHSPLPVCSNSPENCTANALVNDNQSIEPIYSCNWIEFFQQEVGRRHGGTHRFGAAALGKRKRGWK